MKPWMTFAGATLCPLALMVIGCRERKQTPIPPESGDASAPRASAQGLRLSSVSAGDNFTCGLTDAGVAWCWGANQYGQLGSRAATSKCKVDFFADGPCSLVPVPVDGGHHFAALDAGSEHVCALDGDGAAYCWGKNLVGELGADSTLEQCGSEYYAKHLPGDEPEPCVHRPVAVATPLRFTAISVGNSFACALARDGKAYCWGSRKNGYVGAGDRFDHHPEVVAVDAPAKFTQISANGSRACGLSGAGDVYCWGGHRSIAATHVVAPVRFTQVSRGWDQTCALSSDARAYCWGGNDAGELGTGAESSLEGDSLPHAVSVPEPLDAINAAFLSTCAIAKSGALYCWGDGETLGTTAPNRCFHVDEYNPCALAPVRVPLEHVTTTDGGFMHRCALVAGGEVYCWGSNDAGAFGNGARRSSRDPVNVRRQSD